MTARRRPLRPGRGTSSASPRPRPPRPRRRRGGMRRPLHLRRDDPRARAAARLARRRAARGRGVAHRVDQVLLRPRPRPRVLDRPDERALPAGLGAPGDELGQRRAGRRRHRRRRGPPGLRTGSTPGAASPRRRASLGSPAGVEHRAARGLEREVAYLRANLTPGPQRNHRTLELYALLVAALALPDALDPDGELGRVRARRAAPQPAEGTHADGVHREGSTHYHLLVLRSFVGGGARTRAASASTSRPATTSGWRAPASSRCTATAPTGRSRPSRTPTASRYGELLELAGRPPRPARPASGSPAAASAANRLGLAGASFPDGGYFTQRSGWGEGRRPSRTSAT